MDINERVGKIQWFLDLWYLPFEPSYMSLARTKVKERGAPWEERHWTVRQVHKGSDDMRNWIEEALVERDDLYFSALTFTTPKRSNERVIPRTNKLFADLDEAGFDLPVKVSAGLVPQPTWLWETSPGSWQAGWDMSRYVSAEEQAGINRTLTYITEADKGGWHASKLLRVPWSYNAKRGVWAGGANRSLRNPATPEEFPLQKLAVADLNIGGWAPPTDAQWADAVRRAVYEKLVPEHLMGQLFTPTSDRSLKLWKMAREMDEAGVDKQLGLTLLWGTTFNKWRHKPDTFVAQLAKAWDRPASLLH